MKTFNVYSNKNKAAQDAFEMLAANINNESRKKKIKTIAVTSYNQGEGKTSFTIGLSIAIANFGRKVLLIDANMRKSLPAKRLNEETQPGLFDYLIRKIGLQDLISETNINNFHYLSSGSAISNPVGLLNSVRFEKLIREVQDVYDFVIIDTPALASIADGALVASKSDASILIAKIGATKIPDLKRAKEQLGNFHSNILGVVLNKVEKRDYKAYFSAQDHFLNMGKSSKVNRTKK